MPTADDPHNDIRNAVASGEFQRAENLWGAYMAELREKLRRGVLSCAQWKEAGELMDWVRLVVTCRRAHLQNQLATLQAADAYLADAPAPASGGMLRTRL